jgi:hypothetical protein
MLEKAMVLQLFLEFNSYQSHEITHREVMP